MVDTALQAARHKEIRNKQHERMEHKEVAHVNRTTEVVVAKWFNDNCLGLLS